MSVFCDGNTFRQISPMKDAITRCGKVVRMFISRGIPKFDVLVVGTGNYCFAIRCYGYAGYPRGVANQRLLAFTCVWIPDLWKDKEKISTFTET